MAKNAVIMLYFACFCVSMRCFAHIFIKVKLIIFYKWGFVNQN